MDAKKGVLVTKLEPEEMRVPDVAAETFMKFRPLSGEEIEDAQAAVAKELVERYGPSVLQALSSLTGNTDKTDPDVIKARELREKDPLTGYSPKVLIEFGLVGWRGGDLDGEPLTRFTELDKDTRRWAALQVLTVSRLAEGESESSDRGIAGNDSEHPQATTASRVSGSPSS